MTTENTNSPTWKVCKTFNSALLEDEKEGERLNEIHCANTDEAYCLVDLLNKKERELAEKTNEVERLRDLLERAIEAIEEEGCPKTANDIREELARLAPSKRWLKKPQGVAMNSPLIGRNEPKKPRR